MVGRAVMPRSRKPSEPPGCVGAIPTPSANSEPSTLRNPYDHRPIHTAVAAQQVAEACAAEDQNHQQEGSADPPDDTEPQPPSDSFAGRRKSARISNSVA